MESLGSEPVTSAAIRAVQAVVSFRIMSSVDDPMVQKWMRFRNAVVPGVAVSHVPDKAGRPGDSLKGSGEAGAAVYWRLVASNNRELGRSFYLYQNADQARRHVERVAAMTGQLDVAAVVDGQTTRRGWVLNADGGPVMTCARWYTSSSTAAAAAVSALAAFRTARVLAAPVTYFSTPHRRPASAGEGAVL